MADNEHLSYKAINIFLDHDHLEKVLTDILNCVKNLPKGEQISFAQFFKRYVNVLGFRDSTRAPLPMRVNAYISAFEDKDEVVPFTLSTWVKLNSEFAEKVKTWLEAEGWKDLAQEREYDETEGFLVKWQKKLTADKIVKKFQKDNPDVEFSRDDLILMVLWISGQLPKDQSVI